ncbi:MAG TPA: hypothetical protein VH020_15265 [Stellaceae bacterium]|jgi:hypothetical protein|nr:hypothetical protein [Stellaceae bacterium]
MAWSLRRLGIGFVGGGMVLAAGNAMAAEGSVAFRCPAPGTAIVTSIGEIVALRDGADFHCLARIDGKTVDRVGQMLDASDDDAAPLQRELGAIWPLAVGKSVNFAVGIPNSPIVHQVTVKAKVAIDIPAGHFDTYLIEWTRFGVTCGAMLDQAYRFYYEPHIGAVIKFEREPSAIAEDARNWEAVEIAVPGEEVRPAMSRPGGPRLSFDGRHNQ